MNMTEKQPMKTARFSIALTVLFDKYVFALGGTVSKGSNAKATDTCEVYDSSTNVWYPVPSLNQARSCTSAVSLSHRFIYIFPGQQSKSWNTIEFMDIGHTIDPKEMKKLKWTSVTMNVPEFNCTFAYGSTQVNPNEILIFGGSKNYVFSLDTLLFQKYAALKKEKNKQADSL